MSIEDRKLVVEVLLGVVFGVLVAVWVFVYAPPEVRESLMMLGLP